MKHDDENGLFMKKKGYIKFDGIILYEKIIKEVHLTHKFDNGI